jgi:hypothetical protein
LTKFTEQNITNKEGEIKMSEPKRLTKTWDELTQFERDTVLIFAPKPLDLNAVRREWNSHSPEDRAEVMDISILANQARDMGLPEPT